MGGVELGATHAAACRRPSGDPPVARAIGCPIPGAGSRRRPQCFLMPVTVRKLDTGPQGNSTPNVEEPFHLGRPKDSRVGNKLICKPECLTRGFTRLRKPDSGSYK